MPEKQSMHWERSSAELTARFQEITASVDGLTQRKMFGETAGFVNGNLVTGLHSGRWFVRLPEGQQAEAMALPGAVAFEPMAGRPMRGYTVLPAEVVGDDDTLRPWLDRAVAFGRSLPAKG
jgi:TfoX/Sxy family transcriptional regulator of competence genes